MAHERLSPSEPQKALQAYGKMLPFISSLKSDFTVKVSPRSSGTFDFSVFQQQRELWRWVERLLWRAVVLTSQSPERSIDSQPELHLWKWLDCYASCSSSWPANFRTIHRSTVYSIHLRALVLKHGVLSPQASSHALESSKSPSTPSATPSVKAVSIASSPSQADSQSTVASSWLQSARKVVQEYRAVLTESTKFPRAGERNWKVEDFVDLCVAIWEAHGAVGDYAGWVIDVSPYDFDDTHSEDNLLYHRSCGGRQD